MITIKNKRYIKHALKNSDRSLIEAELWVDDVNELPTADSIERFTLAQGSIAYAIRNGEMYIMDSEGTWYKSGGESS